MHLLTEELVRQGHDVTLAASGDSTTTAAHFAVLPRSLRRADDLKDRQPYDWAHVALSLKHAGKFDVVHNHAGELAMAMSQLVSTPMLTTMHCLTTPDTQFIWDRYGGAYNTISRAQRPPLPPQAKARFLGHVYNAIDVASFPFEATKGEDLLFLSRVAPEKGPHHAIEVARRLGRRLIIAGKVDNYDRAFYEEVIRDQIDGEQIIFFGEADAQEKRELYRKAYCLLMPLSWEEPFGLVMPEALACGTPVVAFNRGSVGEIVRDGVTGFVVESLDEMVEAVGEVGRIDPAACRRDVAARFSPSTMAAGYVKLYEEIAVRPRMTFAAPEPKPVTSAGVSGGLVA